MRLFSGLLLASALMQAANVIPSAGQQAADFTLPSQDGSLVSLHDFKGKWVVLYFYPKDGTSGCTIEAHNFQRDLAKYEKFGAVIVGVSIDSADSHKEFCAKQGLRFKLLADEQRVVSQLYGSITNLVGYKISARNTFLIAPDGKIAKVWVGVKPSVHSTEVLGELAKMGK